MVVFYAIILCLSAFLAAWAGTRLLRRSARALSAVLPLGVAALVAAVAFLMVVGAPGPVLLAALGLTAALVFWPHRLRLSLCFCAGAVLVGLLGAHAPSAPYLTALPLVAAFGAMAIGWACLAALALLSPATDTPPYGLAAALVLIAAAPLQQPETSSMLLDAALILSGLLGLWMAAGRVIALGQAAHVGVGFLLAYLQMAALWQGAWLAATASMAVWAGSSLLAWMQQERAEGSTRHGI